jgi:hypothetical protein
MVRARSLTVMVHKCAENIVMARGHLTSIATLTIPSENNVPVQSFWKKLDTLISAVGLVQLLPRVNSVAMARIVALSCFSSDSLFRKSIVLNWGGFIC